MKNSIVYLISIVVVLGILAIYGFDLMGYGMNSTTVAVLIGAMIVIILVALFASKIFSKKLDSKDKENSSD